MRKLWLIFAQTVTVSLAVLFVVQTFHPNLLNSVDKTLVIKEAASTAKIGSAESYSVAAKKAMPSVVNVFTSKKAAPNPHRQFMDDPLFRHFFGDQPDDQTQRENSLGSGVIVSSDGLIVTNHHVVESADEIEIALADGRTVPAKIVGTDPETDLAVVKVDVKDLPAITFADAEQSSVGDVVLAIGNPFGVGQTVTQGIISALGRSHLGINTFENFIQTDAPINPGNSGGALIDTQGNLVGVNSAIYSRSGGSMGIGFAIPISLVKQVMEQIISQGSVTRGWIGIEAQDITPELAESFKLKQVRGSLIAGILRGSPAERAGLRPGDILLEINGNQVIDSSSMLNLISGLAPNKQATLVVARDEKEIKVPITIGKRPKPLSAKNDLKD
ncbi:Do family serine endopeptidase [Methyloradius palustris]|uniref:DegQ protease n=1 Tax=Methyloradius palustris TaxID=2778876 RepID=A0A8D5JZS1_9PROT|nr:Do family serine endopeptidase [Methyloradius palustris]BCM23998.1 DegQ protease [Methyloradius palustris]